FPTKDVAL
nr:Chain C, FPT peptide from 65 kDa lower matrix phosphoprotein [synthetic construct]